MLGRAIEIAVSAHTGQTDKGGRPYILHPMWVMNQVRHLGDDFMIVAVLHDVVEDTDWKLASLIKEGFNDKIITALALLTHDHLNTSYDDYIKRISLDTIAKIVKLKDLEHNTKVTRLKGLRKKDFDRLEKYHRAYTYLKD
jgi:GTP diphosphokinase / guanosine-3',5'-bis(diphosphate) 3'-diphosphatase